MNLFFKSWLFIFVFWAVVVGAWIIGLIYYLPFKYWWFDVLMHFFGGLWVLSLILTSKNYYNIEIITGNKSRVSFIIFVSIVVFVGIVWEFFEFILDRYILQTGFSNMRGVYEDTLLDLFMDMIGGAVGSLAYLLSKNKIDA